MVGFSLMVGIAGWRAHAHRSGEYRGRVFRDCTPEERAALGAGPNDLAVRCVVIRRKTRQHAMEFDGGGLAGPVRIVDEDSGEIIDAEPVTVDAGETITCSVQPASSDAEDGAGEQAPGADKPGRPYSPDVLKAKLTERAAGYGAREVSSKQRGLAAAMLEACFAGDQESERKRRELTVYLLGVSSLREARPADVLALLDWLRPAKDSDGAFVPDALAIRKAQAVLREAEEPGMVEEALALGGVIVDEGAAE